MPDDSSSQDASRQAFGDSVPGEVRDEVFRYLHSSPRALEILDDINLSRDSDEDIEIRWAPSGKNLCYEDKIWVDRDQKDARATAVAVGHEISHLQASVSGACADWRTMTRDEYIQVSTDEEINAHAASYVIHLQATRDSGDRLRYRGIEPVAFGDFEKWRSAIPAGEQRTWSDIEELAKDWAEDQYVSGAWVTGTTGKNYHLHFAERYDDLSRGESAETGNTHSSPVLRTVSQAARPWQPGNGARATVGLSPAPSEQPKNYRSCQNSATVPRGAVPRPKSRGKRGR
ncbi:hypothetical protein [Streptomyces axinellae]|uniref:Uncharacterized protein n=1 Tax=Streptomyces axinellae TaxID=552788 RepID=A0ABN3PZZ6_9ACTN